MRVAGRQVTMCVCVDGGQKNNACVERGNLVSPPGLMTARLLCDGCWVNVRGMCVLREMLRGAALQGLRRTLRI